MSKLGWVWNQWFYQTEQRYRLNLLQRQHSQNKETEKKKVGIVYWWFGKTWKDFACAILTFGNHSWKHYPGKARYVRCRICHRLPKAQWEQLQKMEG